MGVLLLATIHVEVRGLPCSHVHILVRRFLTLRHVLLEVPSLLGRQRPVQELFDSFLLTLELLNRLHVDLTNSIGITVMSVPDLGIEGPPSKLSIALRVAVVSITYICFVLSLRTFMNFHLMYSRAAS